LMPRDPTRFYDFVHWQVAFWILGIHTLGLQRCRNLLPELTGELRRRYRWRRFQYLMMQMSLCLKHKRWDRVREGLAIWQDADDWKLRLWGILLGKADWAPDWYYRDYWRGVSIKAEETWI